MSASLCLRRIRPERNERRFYHMAVTTDLFGTILFVRRWGRIGTDGQQRFQAFETTAAAEAALARLAQAKQRRGYERCRGDSPKPL